MPPSLRAAASPASPWLVRPVLLAWLLPVATAQTWATIGAPQPIGPFGAANQLLGRDLTGLVGFDEQLGRTMLPAGATWVSLPAAIPTRQLATMFTSRDRVHLFGGLDNSLGLVGDLWRFDRTTLDWTLIPHASGPTPRFGAVAASIGSGQRTIVFGGTDATGVRNDTWILLDLGLLLWAQQVTPPGLVARTDMAFASGPDASAVLFGGQASTLLGDTWIFRGTTWTQHQGSGPPAAADGRMLFDPQRNLTVLLHPNGETWEWNDFHWRRVPASGGPLGWNQPALSHDPAPNAGFRAHVVDAAGLTTWAYSPSLASFVLTEDSTCVADGQAGLRLAPHQNSLPYLGQTFQLRTTGVVPSSLCIGALELSTLNQIPWECGCIIGLSGNGTYLQFVPGTTVVRDWALPIAANPLLLGVPIDVQTFLIDANQPCLVMTSQIGMLTPGN
jgi:hypothetical protein